MFRDASELIVITDGQSCLLRPPITYIHRCSVVVVQEHLVNSKHLMTGQICLHIYWNEIVDRL